MTDALADCGGRQWLASMRRRDPRPSPNESHFRWPSRHYGWLNGWSWREGRESGWLV